MSSVNWKDKAELVGIAAIVASLVFVGVQLKQTQDIAMAAQYQERAGTVVQSLTAMMQSPEGMTVWGGRAQRNIESTWDSSSENLRERVEQYSEGELPIYEVWRDSGGASNRSPEFLEILDKEHERLAGQ